MLVLVIIFFLSWYDLDLGIININSFDWLIFIFINGVDYFFERLVEKGKDSCVLVGVKIVVVGKKIAESLKICGLVLDFILFNFVVDFLVVNFFEKLSGKKILFFRVEIGG